MQAIILATSETDGLRPLTETIPTAMLPVLSRPMMVGAIELLAQQGIKNVVVSLYHMPGSIEAYFGTGQRWNLSLEYVLQREPWGSAGALKWAENLLTETFLVLPADQVFELNIRDLLEWHNAHQSHATAIIHPRGMGVGVSRSSDERVTAIHTRDNLSSVSLFATGIYLFEPHILQSIPSRTVWGIDDDLLPHLIQTEVGVYGYPLLDFWHPIASFQDYQSAHWNYLEHLEAGEDRNHPVRPDVPLRARPVARSIWVGRNTLIHPTTRISPPVFIGENSFIGRDVELGPEAMVGANVLIDDGATISRSTVLDNTYIGQFVHVKSSVANAKLLIDVETGQSIQVVDQFLLGEVQTFNSGSLFQRLPNVLIACFLLAGLSPFLLILGFIAWFSTGKLFFRVPMVGSRTNLSETKDQLKHFHLWHFSTRPANGKASKWGNWLESWEFHRLPELWNVVIGDLRLIGVKSLSPHEAGKMVEQWQQKRNDYPPGFTGLWYIQAPPDSTLDEILVTDAYYVATRSWHEDARIFWQTVPVWWKRVRSAQKALE